MHIIIHSSSSFSALQTATPLLIILKMEHIILWGRFLKYRNAAVKNELLRRTEDKLRRQHRVVVLPKNNLI